MDKESGVIESEVEVKSTPSKLLVKKSFSANIPCQNFKVCIIMNWHTH